MQLVHHHGGDLDAIEREYGIPRNEIKDFSGNINPLGFPKSVEVQLAKNLDIISTYPDKNYFALREAIADYTGANAKDIVVGNGSTELISAFIQTVNPKNSIIIGPAYSEYEREVSLLGSSFTYFPLKEEDDFKTNITALIDALDDTVDMLVASNPNNPTGSAMSAKELRIVLTHCKKMNISVMIDETYAEFSDNLDEICAIPLTKEFENLFVTRGTSKFFAAPGIRLGYGISSNDDFKKHLKANQDPWSVNSLADFAGKLLFQDEAFHQKTQKLISDERNLAFAELSTWKNIKAYPSSSNFILLRLLTDKTNAAELYDKMIVKKMVIRDASSFAYLDESYLRFCILAPEDNAELLKELKKWVE